ncbi:hypothetical protein [Paraburkholderia caribensis]|uniref:hypothetical protein n=1 Tax=Paraburkholderia caribensis TaxID=75105 RepID=UPI000AED532A
MNMSSDYLLIWSNFEGSRYPSLRDHEGKLLEPFTSYLHSVVRRSAERFEPNRARSEIQAATYAVTAFCEFLQKQRRRLTNVDQKLLLRFRNDAFEQTLVHPSGHGRQRPAAKTTNVKLRHVYNMLTWCQENRRIPKQTIGPRNCRVTSTLPCKPEQPHSSALDYPLCYRGIGENARIDESQYWATDEDIRRVEEIFREKHGRFTAERNVLLLRLGEHEGWRVGSSVSLRIEQFSDEAFEEQKNADAFEVCPPDQKLGYQFSFSMPWPLAYFIKNYVETNRAEHMQAHGISEEQAQHRIFLNARDGSPLRPRSVSQIFSAALRELGRPKRAAYHAFRRYKAQKIAEEIIERRTREGKSLAPDDVVDEIARALGHASREAQRAYVRATKKASLRTVEERQHDDIVELQLLLAEERAKNSSLKRQLDELSV